MVHNIIIKKKTTTTFECTPISNGLWHFSMCTSETFSSALHKIDIDRRHRIALNAINKVDSFEITALQLPTSAASHLATHLHDYELGSGHHHVAHRLPSPWIPQFSDQSARVPSAQTIESDCCVAIKIVCIWLQLFIYAPGWRINALAKCIYCLSNHAKSHGRYSTWHSQPSWSSKLKLLIRHSLLVRTSMGWN